MTRRLDRKLDAILAGRYTPDDFIIADAKDADMAFGVAAPWRGRSRGAYLDNMRELVAADALDILLTSASNGERVASDGSLDEEVTLAVRANDTTDVWNHRGSSYTATPSRPFRTADLTAVREFCDLVLYSVTFNNDLERDVATLEAFSAFRREAACVGIRYFLEVFNPNAPVDVAPEDVGAFVNDSIIRTLAGVTAATRISNGKKDTNALAAKATDRSTNSNSNSRDHNRPSAVASSRVANPAAERRSREVRLVATSGSWPVMATPRSGRSSSLSFSGDSCRTSEPQLSLVDRRSDIIQQS